MGPSLRVRPHRPTYMRLQKDHQKPAKKKRRRRREMPRHPHPSRVEGVCIPPHPQASSPPIPHAETPTPPSQQPAAPACLPPSPARVSPPAFSNPILWLEKLSPPNLQSDEARLSGTAGRPRPCRRPSLAPPLLLPPPTHTHLLCCAGRGTWTNEYILCMLPKTACLQRYNYKKARVQRTFYPISL